MIGTIKKIFNVLDWITSRFDTVILWFKKFLADRKEKKIDKIIDNHDISSATDVMQSIKDKREKRRNSS